MNFKFSTIERETERQIYHILFVWIWYVNIGKCLFQSIAATNMSFSKHHLASKLSKKTLLLDEKVKFLDFA